MVEFPSHFGSLRTMLKLDNMPTQKSKRRRKTPVQDEVETATLVPTEDVAERSADGTATPDAAKTVDTTETEITKPKSTLKKGCKPHFVPFDEVNYPQQPKSRQTTSRQPDPQLSSHMIRSRASRPRIPVTNPRHRPTQASSQLKAIRTIFQKTCQQRRIL
jgi:hypothetical protein